MEDERMSKITRLAALLLIFVFGISACNLPSNADVTPTQGADAVLTAAAQTVEANLTQAAILNPPTVPAIPTSTQGSAPTSTLAVATNTQPVATNTQICDLALFVKDVSIPDGTEFDPNETFTKTWQIKNIGTCTWSGYTLVFDSGDSMGGSASTPIGSVAPNQEVNLSVDLKAPASAGSYRGYWRIKNSGGVLIPVSNGYQSKSFFVDIKVVAPTPTPTNTPEPKADLIINLLELTPSTPTQGNAVTVKVQVYNQGNAPAGAFQVAWWPGENYPSPECTWSVPSLVAMGGLVLNCNYATGYPSPYASIVTKASADTGNTISESNESNNDAKLTISVNP
jgi:hypothetical protein